MRLLADRRIIRLPHISKQFQGSDEWASPGSYVCRSADGVAQSSSVFIEELAAHKSPWTSLTRKILLTRHLFPVQYTGVDVDGDGVADYVVRSGGAVGTYGATVGSYGGAYMAAG